MNGDNGAGELPSLSTAWRLAEEACPEGWWIDGVQREDFTPDSPFLAIAYHSDGQDVMVWDLRAEDALSGLAAKLRELNRVDA